MCRRGVKSRRHFFWTLWINGNAKCQNGHATPIHVVASIRDGMDSFDIGNAASATGRYSCKSFYSKCLRLSPNRGICPG